MAAHWARIAANPGAHIGTEEAVVAGDRCTVCWVYRKVRDGQFRHSRGIDLFTVRDGKIAESAST